MALNRLNMTRSSDILIKNNFGKTGRTYATGLSVFSLSEVQLLCRHENSKCAKIYLELFLGGV